MANVDATNNKKVELGDTRAPSPEPAMSKNLKEETCILCGGTELITGESKRFYIEPICNKCLHSLVNRRVLAYIIDIFVCGLIGGLTAGFFDGLFSLNLSEIDLDVLTRFLGITFFLIKDGFNGISPGKHLLKLKVVDADTNEPIGFDASFKRNLPLIIPFLPLIAAFQLKNGQRIGEGWANTKVVWKKFTERSHAPKKVFQKHEENVAPDSASGGSLLPEKIFTKRKTKKCPYCGEKIFSEAIKCQHCKEFLNTP